MKYTLTEVQDIVMEALQATIEVSDKNNLLYYAQAGTVLGAIRHQGPIPWDHDADLIVPNNMIDAYAECLASELPSRFYVDYYKIGSKSQRQFPRIGLKGYDTRLVHLDIFRLVGLPNERSEQEQYLKEVNVEGKSLARIRDYSVARLLKRKDVNGAFCRLGLKGPNVRERLTIFDEMCNRYPYEEAEYVANPSGKYGVKNIFKKEVYGEGILVDFKNFKIRIPSMYDPYLKQYYKDYMKTPPQEEIDKEMSRVFVAKRK